MSISQKEVYDVVIVGAGVAGLMAAYGLRKAEAQRRQFRVRIFERRQTCDWDRGGYPIHLSGLGRKALQKVLSPEEWSELKMARKSLGTRHDGITVLDGRMKRMFHTIREPGESCMVERGELVRILQRGAGHVEFNRQVEAVHDMGDVVLLKMDDGEMLKADLVIAADGMYSSIRRQLYREPDFDKSEWSTINIRTSQAMSKFLHDPYGLNVTWGKGWSAPFAPLDEGVYVALTVRQPFGSIVEALDSIEPHPFIDALKQDPGLKTARAFSLHSSARTLPGKGRIVLCGDASNFMYPFCGSGASAGMQDGYELSRALVQATDMTAALESFRRELVKRNTPIVKAAEKALWLAQGDTMCSRAVRTVTFRALDAVETILPPRRRKERELEAKLRQDAVKTVTSIDSPSVSSQSARQPDEVNVLYKFA